MWRLRPTLGFFLRFLLALVLLMFPWPGLKEKYGDFFRTAGGTLYDGSYGDGIVRIHPRGTLTADDVPPGYPLPAADRERDIHLLLKSRRAPNYVDVLHANSRSGYLPTAFVASLILATPIPWSRRWRALLWGLLWINVYVMAIFGFFIVYAFSMDNPVALIEASWARRMIRGVYEVVLAGLAGSYIFPLPIWFLVSFRAGDLARILPRRAGAVKGPPGPAIPRRGRQHLRGAAEGD